MANFLNFNTPEQCVGIDLPAQAIIYFFVLSKYFFLYYWKNIYGVSFVWKIMEIVMS